MKNETYISVDIETSGPEIGRHYMMSLGAVAYGPNGTELGFFFQNLEPIFGWRMDPSTKRDFWDKNPVAYKKATENTHNPYDVMNDFYLWVKQYKNPVAVCYPAGFDFPWVYQYLMMFAGKSPFSFSCIDIKTLAWEKLGAENYRESSKKNWPNEWFSNLPPHTHIAVDDAREQGQLFFNIRDWKNKNNV